MSGTMPVRARIAAWSALKRAAQQCVDAEEAIDCHSMTADEFHEAEQDFERSREKLLAVWRQFPEGYHDKLSDLPPAKEILASIHRQEEALKWAARMGCPPQAAQETGH